VWVVGRGSWVVGRGSWVVVVGRRSWDVDCGSWVVVVGRRSSMRSSVVGRRDSESWAVVGCRRGRWSWVVGRGSWVVGRGRGRWGRGSWVMGRGRGHLVPSLFPLQPLIPSLVPLQPSFRLSFRRRISLLFRLLFRRSLRLTRRCGAQLLLLLCTREWAARGSDLRSCTASRLVLLRRVCGWAGWRPGSCPRSARESGQCTASTYALAQRRGSYCRGRGASAVGQAALGSNLTLARRRGSCYCGRGGARL